MLHTRSDTELCRPTDAAEAAGIEALLRAEGIPCDVVPVSVTPYPTVDNFDMPWGVIRVPPQHLARARSLLTTWRNAVPEDLEQAWRSNRVTPLPARQRELPTTVYVMLILLGLTFVAMVLGWPTPR